MASRNWRLIVSALISLTILLIAFINRAWLSKALHLMWQAEPLWVFASLVTILISYLISSQVFTLVLSSLGYRLGVIRLWATALVAIIISQSIPAGGVGSYAFLVGKFTRHGIPSGKAALIASLEMLSYICAMLLIFGFSLIYLALHRLEASLLSYTAALVAVLVIGTIVFLLTRSEAHIRMVGLGLKNGVARLSRRHWEDTWILHIVDELVHGRQLLAENLHIVVQLVFVQLVALSGHSLAMLMVLTALGVEASFLTVLSAFGIGLITSSFNILPGGGGTVEAALVAILASTGAGAAAVPAAILFRLLNFWLLAPVAAVCYHWLMHEQPALAKRHSPSTSLD